MRLALCYLLCGIAWSQSTGTILGTVVDSSGARVPDVSITALNEETGERRSTVTNSSGDYQIPALPVGAYRISAGKEGFNQPLITGIKLDVAQNARVDLQLQLGQITQQVQITGDVPLVDTHQAQVGALVDSRRVVDLPINGRNVYSLATVLAGVSNTSLPTQPDTSAGEQMNVNGSRILQTSFLLDGGLNNGVWRNSGLLSPNPDTVQEFRLITSNYNAEFGRSAGGVVDVVTKSGANALHGTLFEYLRNDAMDARSYFQPTVAKLRQNQFGGAVGGPVVRNKLFYFFSYQGFRNRTAPFVNAARTPTAAQRSGDFTNSPASQRPRDPANNQPFPIGTIPAIRLDPVALKILDHVAPPNTPDGRVEAARPQSDNNNQYFGKTDYLIGPAHRLAASLFIVRSQSKFPFTNTFNISNVPGYDPETVTVNQHNLVLNEIWTARPNLLNQFTFSYVNVPTRRVADNTFSWPDFGSKYVPGSRPTGPPRFIVTGGWQGGTQGNVDEVDQTFQFVDTVSWLKGPHSIKFGGLFYHLVYDFDGTSRSNGIVTVNNSFTGNAFSDFLLGRAASFQGSNGFTPHLRSRNYAAFFQDDWKISGQVTLNLGIRYEVFTPWVDTRDNLQQFMPGQQSKRFASAPPGLVFPGDAGVPRGLVKVDRNNFAPRIGFAIDPFANGRTAIRGGYGVFHSTGFAGLANSNAGQPFQIDVTAFGTPSFVDPFANAGGNPFPVPQGSTRFVLPVTAAWMDPGTTVAYVQQYNLLVERQMARGLSLSAGYVGNTSRKLQYQRDFNQAVFIPGQSTAANVNDRRPYLPGTYANIQQAIAGANANYNALQVTLNRRFSHGFTFLANYTYSKTIDSNSADQQSVGQIDLTDSNNLRQDRGVSNLDLRHIFNLSFVFETPKLAGLGFAGRHLIGGWQINGIARYSSGRPFNVTSGVDSNLNGNNNDRPNVIGDPHLSGGRPRDQRLARYFNPAAFVPAPAGSNGSAGRNPLYGPGGSNWDLSVFRDFQLAERKRFQFRAESFNVLNHARFNNPVSNLGNANVGQILAAGPGRVMQFGLRFFF